MGLTSAQMVKLEANSVADVAVFRKKLSERIRELEKIEEQARKTYAATFSAWRKAMYTWLVNVGSKRALDFELDEKQVRWSGNRKLYTFDKSSFWEGAPEPPEKPELDCRLAQAKRLLAELDLSNQRKRVEITSSILNLFTDTPKACRC